MTFYTGEVYRHENVRIGPPGADVIRQVSKASDAQDEVRHWSAEAQAREDILYFSIFRDQRTVGQILLHDIDDDTGESLVGYHLFEAHDRGQGIGTQALQLLQTYVMTQTALKKLVIITSRGNLASQGIAQKCGFSYVGASREDPINGVVFVWVPPVAQ